METDRDKVLYVASCSAVKGVMVTVLAGIFLAAAITFFIVGLKIISFVFLGGTIISAIAGCLKIIAAKFNKIIFYDSKVVERKGIINTKEKSSLMTGIVGVSVEQNFFGKIFNYGNVIIDKVGKGWDISTSCISRPNELKRYIEKLIEKVQISNNINTFLAN